mgnify:FL=1|tara:strand:+ start:410 stop:661 length:252 start_codon:yes stop_codon:yes gene_type:complete
MERDLQKVLETLKSHEADNELLNDVLLMILTNQIESLRSTKNAVSSLKDNITEERTITQNQIEIIRDFVADLAERLIVLEKKL